MSEYASITVKCLPLMTFRNYLSSYIVNLFFSKQDLVVTSNCKIDEDEDAETYTQYVYRTTVKEAKERLDARGFSVHNFENIFKKLMIEAIDYSGFLHHLKADYDEYETIASQRIKERVTFKKWENAMHKIISYELFNGKIYRHTLNPQYSITTECDKVIYYSVTDDDYGESFYGLRTEFIDIAYIFRLILEFCDNEDEIVLDFSNIQYWAEDCISKGIAATDDVEKIIVLVEGTSDKDILEFSMNQIYPHLSDLFYFMDFDDLNGGKRDGGTSYVIKNLKTFYFSKLKSKFIAIFDNDAEGYSSKCSLLNEIKLWPNNFRILLYPDNKTFHKYPTLAPNGDIVMDDITKKACSIELYLPDDLIKTNGEYLPIEWESRKRIKMEDGREIAFYQGVISKKDEIKKQFHELRKLIEKDSGAFDAEKWARMKQLLDTIVFAFAKDDGD